MAIYRDCAECGAPVKVTKQRIAKSKSGLFFCTNACHGRYSSAHGLAKPPLKQAKPENQINTSCAFCGRPLVRVRRNERPTVYGHFCNSTCMGKWRAENLTGENSPGWKGGYTLDYGFSNWKSQRRKARERDGNMCQDCGATRQSWGYALDVHHIIPYDMFDDPAEANDLANLVTLCRDCHVKRHCADR